MGLRMYAHRYHRVTKWKSQPPEEQYDVRVTRGGKQINGIETARIISVEEETKRWYGANHIHGWFVDNVQNGEDDHNEYYIGFEQLQALNDTCDQVIAASKLVDGMVYIKTVYDIDHPHGDVRYAPGKVIEDPTVAKKLLPTRSGFFFGSRNYDSWYLETVEETRDWAAQMLADRKNGVPGKNYYSSSW